MRILRAHLNKMSVFQNLPFLKKFVIHLLLIHLLRVDSPCNAILHRLLFIIFHGKELDFQNMAVMLHVVINRCRRYLNILAILPVYHSIMWAFLVQSVQHLPNVYAAESVWIPVATASMFLSHSMDNDPMIRNFLLSWSATDNVLCYTEIILFFTYHRPPHDPASRPCTSWDLRMGS